MSAGKYNFIVEQGSQHDVTFRYKLADGTFLDLTNYRVRMSVKDHITDTNFVYQASSNTGGGGDTGGTVAFQQHFTKANQAGDTLGQFTLSIPTATTTGFNFNQGVYDLELVANDGTVTRILEGKFKIKLQVSV
jgi:hypothetical protein